jgi:hypothetical protein
MREGEDTKGEPGGLHLIPGVEGGQVDAGRARAGAWLNVLIEDVGESGTELCRMLLRHQHGHRPAAAYGEDAQVVDAVDVVGVHMREEDRIHAIYPSGQELQAQLRWCINQEDAVILFDGQAVTRPAVTRIARRADPAGAADHGHTEARPSTEEA